MKSLHNDQSPQIICHLSKLSQGICEKDHYCCCESFVNFTDISDLHTNHDAEGKGIAFHNVAFPIFNCFIRLLHTKLNLDPWLNLIVYNLSQ